MEGERCLGHEEQAGQQFVLGEVVQAEHLRHQQVAEGVVRGTDGQAALQADLGR